MRRDIAFFPHVSPHGGAAARWRSGAVVQRRSGAVARWRGGTVAHWRIGAVARWHGSAKSVGRSASAAAVSLGGELVVFPKKSECARLGYCGSARLPLDWWTPRDVLGKILLRYNVPAGDGHSHAVTRGHTRRARLRSLGDVQFPSPQCRIVAVLRCSWDAPCPSASTLRDGLPRMHARAGRGVERANQHEPQAPGKARAPRGLGNRGRAGGAREPGQNPSREQGLCCLRGTRMVHPA